MKKHYSEQLAGLRERVLRMGGLVEQMTRRGVQALGERDVDLLAGAMKINTDMERIGDQAINITERAESLLVVPTLKPLIDIPRMADIAQEMLKDALDAFVNGDDELAYRTILRDDTVDQLKDQVFRELLTFMMSDPTTIPRAMDLILVSRHLQRIADHTTNICEDVIFT